MLPLRSHMFAGMVYVISKTVMKCGITITLSAVGDCVGKFIVNKVEEIRKKKK